MHGQVAWDAKMSVSVKEDCTVYDAKRFERKVKDGNRLFLRASLHCASGAQKSKDTARR